MSTEQIIFLAINIIFGTLVILSYILGLKSGAQADALWGGVSINVRSIYTISMLVSALSFFIFSSYILLNLNADSFTLNNWVIYLLYLLILIPSALWIPLTNMMVADPSTLIWIGVRVVLALVAISTLILLILLFNISPKPTSTHYLLSIIGLIWFLIHTGILDAILWPYLWNK